MTNPKQKEYNRKYRSKPEAKLLANARLRRYREKPEVKEKSAAYHREYMKRPEAKEKWDRYINIYRAENSERIMENVKRNIAKQRATVEGKIKDNLRSRLWGALKQNKKSKKTMELLGCSITFLRSYLEAQFTEGMTWSNIHIDHIRPCASFDLTDPEQQRECFHYSNLQPLFAIDNMKKGAKK